MPSARSGFVERVSLVGTLKGLKLSKISSSSSGVSKTVVTGLAMLIDLLTYQRQSGANPVFGPILTGLRCSNVCLDGQVGRCW